MKTPAWMEQCYQMMNTLRFVRLEVVGFLLGKRQHQEMHRFLREQEALMSSPPKVLPDVPQGGEGDHLWGKPIVWSEADDCAVPLMGQGVSVQYDRELHQNRILVPFRQRDGGAWVWP